MALFYYPYTRKRFDFATGLLKFKRFSIEEKNQ